MRYPLRKKQKVQLNKAKTMSRFGRKDITHESRQLNLFIIYYNNGGLLFFLLHFKFYSRELTETTIYPSEYESKN